jgi:hypothetical protein
VASPCLRFVEEPENQAITPQQGQLRWRAIGPILKQEILVDETVQQTVPADAAAAIIATGSSPVQVKLRLWPLNSSESTEESSITVAPPGMCILLLAAALGPIRVSQDQLRPPAPGRSSFLSCSLAPLLAFFFPRSAQMW